MAFDDLIRMGVGLADRLTAPLQAQVQHESWTGAQTDTGAPALSAAVPRLAIVERRQRYVRAADGSEVATYAKVTFLRPVAMTPRDKITLPDGSTGPIVDVEGMFDPDAPNGSTYLKEVWLGAAVGKGVV